MTNIKQQACCRCEIECCYCPERKKRNYLPPVQSQYFARNTSTSLIKTGDYSRYSSPHYLQGAEVNSCNRVIIGKGKVNRAIPFYAKRKQAQAQPSSMLNSWSQQIHRLHLLEHVGSSHKLLSQYDPNAMRNRLNQVSNKKQARYQSQIQIGGGKAYGRRFLSTYRNHYSRKDQKEMCSHIGILSMKNKWQHKLQER